MDSKTSLLTQPYKPNRDDHHEIAPSCELGHRESSNESSSESPFVCQQLPSGQTENVRGRVPNLGKRPLSSERKRSTGDRKAKIKQSITHRSTVQSIPVPGPAVVKPRKKPGPPPKVKPLKNDAKVKRNVIREIEGYWGKNFVTTYIPRCHHPLVKSTKGKKYRSHEKDPKNWLPSILKSILVIAKLTQDKAWLKKAMNNVVRYRIKHTGNRKPQLTTTDFDVLEDMLSKGWKLEYSFPVRYKHLLAKGKNEEVTDAEIDSIMGRRIRSATRSEEGTQSEDEYSSSGDSDSNDGDSAGEDMGPSSSDQHLRNDGRTEAIQSHSASPQQSSREHTRTPKQFLPTKPNHPRKLPSLSEQQGMYGYTDPASNSWNHPMAGYVNGPMNSPPNASYNGYTLHGGLSNYGNYNGYKPPNQDSREHLQSWPQYGTNPWSPHPSPRPPPHLSDPESSTQPIYRPSPFSPPLDTHPPQETNTYSSPSSIRPTTQPSLADHLDGAEAMSGIRHAPAEPVDDEAAAIEAELHATELELKIARLRARQAALRLQARSR
jgi:hypothetical protein